MSNVEVNDLSQRESIIDELNELAAAIDLQLQRIYDLYQVQTNGILLGEIYQANIEFFEAVSAMHAIINSVDENELTEWLFENEDLCEVMLEYADTVVKQLISRA